jgi:hypothetical protein
LGHWHVHQSDGQCQSNAEKQTQAKGEPSHFIYSLAHHAFERRYVALFILGSPALLGFSAIVVAKSKEDLVPQTPRSEI